MGTASNKNGRWSRLSRWWTHALFPGRVPVEQASVLWVVLPAAVAIGLLFTRLNCPLLEPEETRYAEIPRQMLAEGRWIAPVWHGQDYWHKPPLLYWLVMLSYQLFGVHDWAARLVPCLAAFSTVLVVYWWGRRTAGNAVGVAAALVLALSARFVYQGRMLTMDGLLALWVTLGLASAHIALAGRNMQRRWWLLSGIACGLGLLTKGPVIIALILPPVALYALLDRRCARIRPVDWAALATTAMIVAGPWYLAWVIQDRGSAKDFIVWHNLRRFIAPFDHEQPAWYFLPLLMVGTLPWSLLIVPCLHFLCRRSMVAARHRTQALGFHVLALAWGLLFFSCSGCKRPAYILPVLPSWALLLGAYGAQRATGIRGLTRNDDLVSNASSVGLARRLTFAGVVLGAMAAWLVVLAGLCSAAPACVATAFAVVVCISLRRFFDRGNPTAAWLCCCGCLLLLLIGAILEVVPAYHRRFALRGQVRRHAAENHLPVACYPRRWDSISFYLQRADVRLYSAPEQAGLVRDLERQERTLVFIKRERYLEGFLKALPPTMTFLPLPRQGTNVRSGYVVHNRSLSSKADRRYVPAGGAD